MSPLIEGRSGSTFRRKLLDQALVRHEHLMRGVVVDLGGKKRQKRGAFQPPDSEVSKWIYVNLDPETAPDILADVQDLPLDDEIADCVISTEVIEHLPEPGACINEAHRILKPGGTLILSTPFIYPIHGDPADYYRFTPSGLRHLCARFESVVIEPMGGYPTVMATLIQLKARNLRWWGPIGLVARKGFGAAALMISQFDSGIGKSGIEDSAYSTGYVAICRKSSRAGRNARETDEESPTGSC